MNTEKGTDVQMDNFSRLNEILILDFFQKEELVKKLDVIKDKVNNWDLSFFEHEVFKALVLMKNFHIRYDDGDVEFGRGESYERSIDLQWQFLTWIVDVVYPTYHSYHVASSSLPDEVTFS